MLKPSSMRPSRVAIVRCVASTCGTRSLTIMDSTGAAPFAQSTYMPISSPFTKTTRQGGALPASIASSKCRATTGMPGNPPPEPWSQ